MKKMAVIFTVLALTGCWKEEVQPQQAVQSPVVKEPSSLSEAIAAYKPEMLDVGAEEKIKYSKGAANLAKWSDAHLMWGELKSLPDGNFALTMKDPDTQRGKKVCFSGRVGDIQAESIDGVKTFEGSIYSTSVRNLIYRYIAVKSTGSITANKKAKFCGVVVGRNSYKNSVGGTTHTVQLVGMFELPENTGATKK